MPYKNPFNPLVSVIIPTTKKELYLAQKCAESIRFSTYHNTEILIINENAERSFQRNLGIERSHGDYIIYLDSDQSVSPNLIEECVELMQLGYDAIYIPEIITTPGFFAKIRNFERSFYNGTAVDCVRFFRRKDCPKFSTELHGPEDSLHDRQIKGSKIISKNCLYHFDGVGFLTYFKKKAYYARSLKKYSELSPSDKCLDFKYRCFWIFIENGKWKKILRHPFLFLCIMVIILIRGIIYVVNR